MAATPHDHILSVSAAPQNASPLFSVLPAEVRSQIYVLTLADYSDPSPDRRYENNTCYSRPSYFAPRKSDTQLLQTCRAVYKECWFLPFLLKEQTHWLTAPNRAPPRHDDAATSRRLQKAISRVVEDQGQEKAEIESLRVFAQMYVLEDGALASLLALPHLSPRSLTLTIRHADWWNWEHDEPLRFEGKWIPGVNRVLPPSVREIRVEMESLNRKKEQVNKIATKMTDRWYFKRTDGATLFADSTSGSWEVSTWSGSSSWHDRRWVRDETEEGKIDYYVATVTFRLQPDLERSGGKVSERAREFAQSDESSHGKLKLFLHGEEKINHPKPFIHLHGGRSMRRPVTTL